MRITPQAGDGHQELPKRSFSSRPIYGRGTAGEHREHQAGDHRNLVSDRGTSVDKPLYLPAGQASSAAWALEPSLKLSGMRQNSIQELIQGNQSE